MRRCTVGEEHPPHSRVALAGDPIGELHGHPTHQGYSGGLLRPGEVHVPLSPELSHTVHIAIAYTASSLKLEDGPCTPC